MAEHPIQPRAVASNLLELLQFRARSSPHREAFTFLHQDEETAITFARLDHRARAVAAALAEHARPGDRALLIYPPGLEFIIGFFGCVYAGVLAVPAGYPNPRRPMSRVKAIVEDCGAAVALSTAGSITALDAPRRARFPQQLRWIATDRLDLAPKDPPQLSGLTPPELAFLQYSSGSTSDPKGVLVSHRNLLHNLEMMLQAQGFARDRNRDPGRSSVFWLPPYHDAGLIGGILLPLYEGGHGVLFPPTAFLQRPLRWLEVISRRRAAVSLAPNFAYELCARRAPADLPGELDLSAWELAGCGAEPVRAETLDRFAETFAPAGFRAESFYPCYGLAEATLFATGGRHPARPAVKTVRRWALLNHRVEAAGDGGAGAQRFVGCGRAWSDQEVLIVDPETRRRCPADHVGEIWIRGPSVARGYWNRPEVSEQTFGARLADSDESPFLRTGDLGFISDGDLYITGRLKNVIIVRGANHYPEDIERTAGSAHRGLPFGGGAAFSIPVEDQENVVVVHEVDRRTESGDLQEVIRSLRRQVSEEHELELYAVVLIRQGSLPRTTSGKVRRDYCRQLYRSGELQVLAEWTARANRVDARKAEPVAAIRPGSGAGDADRLTEQVRVWLTDWLADRESIPADAVDLNRPFGEYGLDSVTALELGRELEERLNIRLTPVVAWKYPTPAMLARYVAQRASGATASELGDSPISERRRTVRGFDRLLTRIEALDESEVSPSTREMR